jgi:hypothetical protein
LPLTAWRLTKLAEHARPRPGRNWFTRHRPARLHPTHARCGGVRRLFAAFDVAAGQVLPVL